MLSLSGAPAIPCAVLFLVAPLIGSFLGTVIRRLPEGRNWTTARSACEKCGHVLQPVEMIPLLSFLALRGRCRSCRSRIDPFHPSVEMAAIGVVVIAWAAEGCGDPASLLFDCILGWWLLTLGWIDWRTLRLPDALTLPLIGAGIVYGAIQGQIVMALLGAVLTAALLELVRLAFLNLRGKAALGRGDIKLMAAIGAWCPPETAAQILLLACLGGLLYYAVLSLRRNRSGLLSHAIPFGPFLSAAFFFRWVLS